MNYIEKLNSEQAEIFNLMISGENIFLTGEAGTGKSFIINAYDQYCTANNISLIKLASTGIAAYNINGTTLHSQFNLNHGIQDTSKYYKIPKILYFVNTILIDEISMCRLDIFDSVMSKIKYANTYCRKKPIQVILVGDFFQLPPVITDQDRLLLNKLYKKSVDKGFCFQSNLWKEFNFKMCNLKNVVRQDNKLFCDALNKARIGDKTCLNYILNNCSKFPDMSAIWLTGKNSSADSINKFMLNKINNQLYTSNAVKYGTISYKDFKCDEVFEFKIGARVMSIINDYDKGYKNGSLGTIIDYDDKNKIIKVKFDNNTIASINKEEFKVFEYVINKNNIIDKNELGSIIQYPLKLAYAITIHKSQGQTFDSVNFIPELFDDGQFYVAMSRCKSIEKVYIKGEILPWKIKASSEVIKFYNNPNNYNF